MNTGIISPVVAFETTGVPDFTPPAAEPAEPAGPAPPPPAAAPEAPPAAAAPPAEPPAGLTAEQIEQLLDERFGGLVGYMEQLVAGGQQPAGQQQPAAPAAPLPEWDPYNPDVVRAYWQDDVRNTLQEVVGPLMEGMEPVRDIATHYAESEAEAELASRFDTFGKQLGEAFDHGQARARAEQFVAQGVGVDQAIERAAREQHAWETQLRQKAVEAYQEQLRTSHQQQQGGGLPAGGTPPVVPEPPGPGEGEDPFDHALRLSLAATRGVNPVG